MPASSRRVGGISQRRPAPSTKAQPILYVLLALLMMLLVAGGASRADVIGQAIVRATAMAALAAALLFAPRPVAFPAPVRPVFFLLLAILLLPLIQLIPLPPGIWQSLSGREIFATPAELSGQPQPWRPWSIVPDATLNAAAALLIPLATLLLASQLVASDRRRLLEWLLGIIAVSAVVGLIQLSGNGFNHPLINNINWEVSGLFANRNHFALFIAMGVLIAPVWAVLDERRSRIRGLIAFALVALFLLILIASGSRSGLVTGAVGLAVALILVRRPIIVALRHYPRWVAWLLLPAAVLLIVVLVSASIEADRAVSIRRALDLDATGELRQRTLPTVLAMTREYLPFGSGMGSFDPIFRMHEPFDLLKPTYFNHAHNDFIEVVLDGGVFGLALLIAAIGWWAWASLRAWRAPPGTGTLLARTGSVLLLLVMIASAFDYPARTPLIMAVIVLSAIWLGWADEKRGDAPLPAQ